jgi:hypothetical protein
MSRETPFIKGPSWEAGRKFTTRTSQGRKAKSSRGKKKFSRQNHNKTGLRKPKIRNARWKGELKTGSK